MKLELGRYVRGYRLVRLIVSFALALLISGLGSTFAQEEQIEPSYFKEEFDAGIPEEWDVSGAWVQSEGHILSVADGDLVVLPGIWEDFSLAMRLRNRGPGIRSIVFRAGDSGSYQVHFRSEGVGLHQTDESGLSTWLDWEPGINHEDWHELVIIAEGDRIFTLLNGESLFDYQAASENALYEGTIGFYNLIAGEFEIDSLTIAPVILSPELLAPKWLLSEPPQLHQGEPGSAATEVATSTSTIRFTLNGGEQALSINAGECVNLQWSVTNAVAVFFQDERTQPSGFWQECLRESTIFVLRVQKADSTVEQRALRVLVTPPTSAPVVAAPTNAATAVDECRLTPDRLNMNLREGDSTDYPIVGRLNFGDYAQVVGRNLADTWYRVDFEGLDAWVAGRGYTRLEGDCSYVLLRTYEPPEPPPTPIPTAPPQPVAPPRANPSFFVNGNTQVYINRGQCVTLSWYAEGIRAIFYQGGGVTGPTGERQECPTQSTTYHLRVEMQDGSTRDLYATAIVNN